MNTDFSWSPYDNEYQIFNLGGLLKDKRKDALALEYRFNRDTPLESLYSEIDIALTKKLTAYYAFEKNLEDKKTVQTQTGFIFTKECWTLDFAVTETSNDLSIGFLFTLHGLGELGTGSKKTLVSGQTSRYQRFQ